MPKLENDRVVYGEYTKEKLPLQKTPVTITMTKIGNNIVVDPGLEEEKVMDARLSVSIYNNKIYAMQKGGEKGLKLEEVDKMISIAMSKVKELEESIK